MPNLLLEDGSDFLLEDGSQLLLELPVYISHSDIIRRLVARLQAMSFTDIASNQIYAAEFPFDRQPAVGLAVSPLTEVEGAGTNERDDFRYGCMIMQIFGGLGHGDYDPSRYDWRQKVRREFHRKLLGEINNEIITKVNPSSIKRSKQWRDWGIDTSVMQVWTWVREPRE